MNEAELLFSEVLNCDRTALYLNKDLFLDRNQSLRISSVLKRRISGEPFQYILGKTEFMGMEFKINKDVFIPRPETEILVGTALRYALSLKPQASSLDILDLGTGSGCIAVSLAKLFPEARVTAIDVSCEALKIARANADLHGVNINFFHGDLFHACNLTPAIYDLIISNPPYIPTEEIDGLQPEVKNEPRTALDGGSNGLNFYHRIITKATKYLKSGGFLIMEMGFNQSNAIKEILQEVKDLELIETVKDYNDIDRVIVIKRKRKNGQVNH